MRSLRICFALSAACLAVLIGHVAAASASLRCDGRYHQIVVGHEGILILREHNMMCTTINRVVRGYEHLGAHSAPRVDGYRCRSVPIQAGGGAERCWRGSRWVLFGFE